MNVLRFPTKARALSILSGAPNRAAPSSFMGFVEAVAWAGLRDERAALAARWHSLDRPDLDNNWIGAAWWMLGDDMAAEGESLKVIEAELVDRCASGDLKAKGRGSEGFHDIPENDWIGAHFVAVKEPDCILCAGSSGKGWSHVRFKRSDVLALWPEIEAKETGSAPVESKTNKRPVWYPLLRSMIEGEHERLERWAADKPGLHPPLFPSAAKFQRTLIGKGFAPADSTVRYHVANIKRELGR